MRFISEDFLRKTTIITDECFNWLEETFLLKKNSILPAKISMKPEENYFFNVMPGLIKKYNIMGTKIVSRIPDSTPLIKSNIFLYDLVNGNLKCILEGNYITTLRTGALGAYTTLKFLNIQEYYEVGLIGLGNVLTMTSFFLFDKLKNKRLKVKLYKYKETHIKFYEKFKFYTNIEFNFVDTYKEVIEGSDIIISGVSYMNENFGDISWYKKGVVIVPIHTRGFQNLDIYADTIIVDDMDHIRGFKYFNQFRRCIELANILEKKEIGRKRKEDIILVYTIGISLLDIIFSLKLLDKLSIDV